MFTDIFNNYRFEYICNIQKALEGKIKLSDTSLNHIENGLKKFFKYECVEIVDSEEEDESGSSNDSVSQSNSVHNYTQRKLPLPNTPKNIKKPAIPIPSIQEYSIKKQTLVPASLYAKPNNNKERKVLTIDQKESIAKKGCFDPKKEAEKLKGIKERIYLNNYLKLEEAEKTELERTALFEKQMDEMKNVDESAPKKELKKSKSPKIGLKKLRIKPAESLSKHKTKLKVTNVIKSEKTTPKQHCDKKK